MLRLTSSGESVPTVPRAPGRRGHAARLTFGGVVFELLSAEPLPTPPAAARYLREGADPRAVADVACAVHVDANRAWPNPRGASIRFETEPGGAIRVTSRMFEVELSELGPRRYAAAAVIAPGEETIVGLLRGITTAIVQREGGLVLHGAGIELDGAGVVFVGPSGAGKSTAAAATRGARCFAEDHLALVPSAEGWLAWGLPGGKVSGAAPADSAVHPVAAVLRVRQAAPETVPTVSRLSGTQALFALRESVECADFSLGAEDVYLRAVTELSSQVTVGAIATVRGRDNASAVRALLGAPRKPVRS